MEKLIERVAKAPLGAKVGVVAGALVLLTALNWFVMSLPFGPSLSDVGDRIARTRVQQTRLDAEYAEKTAIAMSRSSTGITSAKPVVAHRYARSPIDDPSMRSAASAGAGAPAREAVASVTVLLRPTASRGAEAVARRATVAAAHSPAPRRPSGRRSAPSE